MYLKHATNFYFIFKVFSHNSYNLKVTIPHYQIEPKSIILQMVNVYAYSFQ